MQSLNLTIFFINYYESDDNKLHDKIKCFMGYYGLTKAFVHSKLKTPEKDQKRENYFAKSVDEAAQNYPKFYSNYFIKKKK